MRSFCNYTLLVALLLAGSINFMLAQCSGGPLTQLPVTDNFDASTVGTVTFNEFQNSPNGQIDWRAHTGATSSTNTGPTGDITGAGNYIFMETSSPAVAGERSMLISDCLDLNNSVNPVLEFYYHLYCSYWSCSHCEVYSYDGTLVEWSEEFPLSNWLENRTQLDILWQCGDELE